MLKIIQKRLIISKKKRKKVSFFLLTPAPSLSLTFVAASAALLGLIPQLHPSAQAITIRFSKSFSLLLWCNGGVVSGSGGEKKRKRDREGERGTEREPIKIAYWVTHSHICMLGPGICGHNPPINIWSIIGYLLLVVVVSIMTLLFSIYYF